MAEIPKQPFLTTGMPPAEGDERDRLPRGEHASLSEDQLLDLASFYAYGQETGFDFSNLPRDAVARREMLKGYRPSRVWDVFPNYHRILPRDVQEILRGENPFVEGTIAHGVINRSVTDDPAEWIRASDLNRKDNRAWPEGHDQFG